MSKSGKKRVFKKPSASARSQNRLEREEEAHSASARSLRLKRKDSLKSQEIIKKPVATRSVSDLLRDKEERDMKKAAQEQRKMAAQTYIVPSTHIAPGTHSDMDVIMPSNTHSTIFGMNVGEANVENALKIKNIPLVGKTDDRAVNPLSTVTVKKPLQPLVDSLGDEYFFVKKDKILIGLNKEGAVIRSTFTIAKYPVTKARYLEFVNEEKIVLTDNQWNSLQQVSPYDNCPAVYISWNDAKLFCRWMREITGDYYSLPTQLEWEAAARGKDGRVYPWGDNDPDSRYACFDDGEFCPGSTASVDYYGVNTSPCGAVGMVGNVMEWTLDKFDDERDPHILRGGSWRSSVDYCNTYSQCLSFPPDKRVDFAGLRLIYLPRDLYEDYANP